MAKLLTNKEIYEDYPEVYRIFFEDSDRKLNAQKYMDYCKDRGYFYVFVYGTLKTGESNHRVMESAGGELVDNVFVNGFTCINTPWYPYAVWDRNSKSLHGELYKVPMSGLKQLDMLEGYPSLYNRDVVVAFGEGDNETRKITLAWIYSTDWSSETNGYVEKYGTTNNWTTNNLTANNLTERTK